MSNLISPKDTIYKIVTDPLHEFWGSAENTPTPNQFDELMQDPSQRNKLFDMLSTEEVAIFNPKLKDQFNAIYANPKEKTWKEDVGKFVADLVPDEPFIRPQETDEAVFYGAGVGLFKSILDLADYATFGTMGFADEISEAMEVEMRKDIKPGDLSAYNAMREQSNLAEVGTRAAVNSGAFLYILGTTGGIGGGKSFNAAYEALAKAKAGSKGIGKLGYYLANVGVGFGQGAVTFAPKAFGSELGRAIRNDEEFKFSDVGKETLEMGVETLTEALFPAFGFGKRLATKAISTYGMGSFFEGLSESLGDVILEGREAPLAKFIEGKDLTIPEQNSLALGFILGAGMGGVAAVKETATTAKEQRELKAEGKKAYSRLSRPKNIEAVKKAREQLVTDIIGDPKKSTASKFANTLERFLDPNQKTESKLQAEEALEDIDANILDQTIIESIISESYDTGLSREHLSRGYSPTDINKSTRRVISDISRKKEIRDIAKVHGVKPVVVANIAMGQKLGYSDQQLIERITGEQTANILETGNLSKYAPEVDALKAPIFTELSSITPYGNTIAEAKDDNVKTTPETEISETIDFEGNEEVENKYKDIIEGLPALTTADLQGIKKTFKLDKSPDALELLVEVEKVLTTTTPIEETVQDATEIEPEIAEITPTETQGETLTPEPIVEPTLEEQKPSPLNTVKKYTLKEAPEIGVSEVDLEESNLDDLYEEGIISVRVLDYRGKNNNGVKTGTILISGKNPAGETYSEKFEVFFKETATEQQQEAVVVEAEKEDTTEEFIEYDLPEFMPKQED
ncbi:MAG: hypothetical protein DRH90_21400, partial [Deltaproteobacteria bacterium]